MAISARVVRNARKIALAALFDVTAQSAVRQVSMACISLS
jgi:hypothetical protein